MNRARKNWENENCADLNEENLLWKIQYGNHQSFMKGKFAEIFKKSASCFFTNIAYSYCFLNSEIHPAGVGADGREKTRNEFNLVSFYCHF